jgi:hypothetical protein
MDVLLWMPIPEGQEDYADDTIDVAEGTIWRILDRYNLGVVTNARTFTVPGMGDGILYSITISDADSMKLLKDLMLRPPEPES